MKKTSMIVCLILGLLLILVGSFVGIAEGIGVGGFADDWETETVAEFPIAEISAIEVEVQGMDVSIYDGWNKTIEVDVSVSKTQNVQVWQQGSTLYVRQKESGKLGTDSGRIIIRLPKGGAGTISVLSASGDVGVSGVRGEDFAVELATVSGDLYVYGSRLSALTCSTTSGDLSLNEVEVYGPTKLSTISGYLNCYDLEAEDVAMETTSGAVYSSDVLADSLSAKTTSGTVNISDIAIPDVAVETTSGDVWLTLPGEPEDYTVKLSTVSGDVEGVRERTGGKWDLAVSTTSGDVWVSFE